MYDANKIIPGIIIFLVIITFPVWFSVASGKASYVPEPQLVTEEDHCVEDLDEMREEHAKLLDSWRNEVVREGNRTYVACSGGEYEMSLTRTCLGCHPNKAEFCDTCHNYTGVQPDCWNCHNVPEWEPSGEPDGSQ